MRYIKRTTNGSIVYRRVIPQPLRAIIGQREFKRKIGETINEATRAYGAAQKEYERLIETAKRASSHTHLIAMQAKLTQYQIAEQAAKEIEELRQATVRIGDEVSPLTDYEAAYFVADVMQDYPSLAAKTDPQRATQERMV